MELPAWLVILGLAFIIYLIFKAADLKAQLNDAKKVIKRLEGTYDEEEKAMDERFCDSG